MDKIPYAYSIIEDYISMFPTFEKLLQTLKCYKPCYIRNVTAYFDDGNEESYELDRFIELGYVVEVQIDMAEAEKYADEIWSKEHKAQDEFLSTFKGTVTGCFGARPKTQILNSYILEHKYQWR